MSKEFLRRVEEAGIGTAPVEGMVQRDIRYKRTMLNRQNILLLLIIVVVIILIFNILILRETLDMNDKLIKPLIDVISQQSKVK